jgi:hypothetical protein
MNNELTKTFPSMTTSDIAAFAASDNLDDNQLADRLARRIVLEVRAARSVTLSPTQSADLAALVEVTDAELARI